MMYTPSAQLFNEHHVLGVFSPESMHQLNGSRVSIAAVTHPTIYEASMGRVDQAP